MKKQQKQFETRAIRNHLSRSEQKEHSVPVYLTSAFVFENAEEGRAVFAGEKEANMYTRISNPNNDEFAQKISDLEGTEAGIATSTGMASIYVSLITFLRPGDHIIASRSLFSSSYQIISKILPQFGITHTYVTINDNNEWEKSILPSTKMIFVETPSNPGLDIADLEHIGKLAKENNLYFVVDNCFATPYLQNPVRYGANIITHSATKYIDGQGRVMGGAVAGEKEYIDEINYISKNIGTTLSPFNSWILSKSLETLAIRMEKHCSNAMHLAGYFEKNKNIKTIKYPFLNSHPDYKTAKKQMKLGGGIVTIELKGGTKRCKHFLDCLKMINIAPNLGDTRTIATHPSSTTHSSLSKEEKAAVGISDDLIRISVGLEHIDDIIADIDQAVERSKKK